jgi:thiamine pyrophosphate-dependent acetolactate synthase large subunit-like protein
MQKPVKNNLDTVAGSVLSMLGHAGVETVFGLPGVHNLAFWQCAGEGIPKIVTVRHEQTTVYAADGAARATGRLGVALTTTGPGAANAVGAFGEAAASGSPVLLIASEISTALARRGVMRGVLHESPDQAALFAPLAKAVYRPRSATAAIAAVADAIAMALSWPQGPVYVDIPTDVLHAMIEPMPVLWAQRRAPVPEAIERAASLICRSRRIVVWAGGGIVQSGAEAELQEFAELIAAPVVTTFAANGVLSRDHPNSVGLPPHEPEIAQLIGDADLLIGVGTDFDGMNTRNWSMPRPELLIAINCDATDLSKNYPPTVAVHSDAKLALAMLITLLDKRDSTSLEELADVRSSTWARLRAEPISAPGCSLVDAVGSAARIHDAVVVADMAIAGYWVGGYGQFDRSRRLQYPVGWGTLGFAVPASIGAALVSGRPTLAICGDGGFMFAIGELAVLVQENLPITILLVDDGGYGMLRYEQRRVGDEERGVNLVRPDFVSLSDAFGITASTVDSVGEELEGALVKALSSGQPKMVVVRTSLMPPRTTSPRWNE